MVKKIDINGQVIIIDKKDLEKVEAFSKNKIRIIDDGNGRKYPSITKRIDGKYKTILLARLITNAPKNRCITYADKDTLNLRKSNLIMATKSNASRIKSKATNRQCTSKYLGVSFAKQINKWYAQIKPSKNKPNKNLGYYDKEVDAAKAYNDAAIKHHGEEAMLNKIK
jgi:uncharacterized protein YlzI (FlbEa/FlbD family)